MSSVSLRLKYSRQEIAMFTMQSVIDRVWSVASVRPGIVKILGALLLMVFATAPLSLRAADEATINALLAQAEAAQREGRPKQVITALSKAIEAAPAREDLYLRRARAYDSTG